MHPRPRHILRGIQKHLGRHSLHLQQRLHHMSHQVHHQPFRSYGIDHQRQYIHQSHHYRRTNTGTTAAATTANNKDRNDTFTDPLCRYHHRSSSNSSYGPALSLCRLNHNPSVPFSTSVHVRQQKKEDNPDSTRKPEGTQEDQTKGTHNKHRSNDNDDHHQHQRQRGGTPFVEYVHQSLSILLMVGLGKVLYEEIGKNNKLQQLLINEASSIRVTNRLLEQAYNELDYLRSERSDMCIRTRALEDDLSETKKKLKQVQLECERVTASNVLLQAESSTPSSSPMPLL